MKNYRLTEYHVAPVPVRMFGVFRDFYCIETAKEGD
jgi:hypothetical protein